MSYPQRALLLTTGAVLLTLIGNAPADVSGLPADILGGVLQPDLLPQGMYVPADAWEAEGNRAGHNGGAAVDDPDAGAGRAWEALPGRDRADTLLFGPYVEGLPAGAYVAFFRLKLVGDEEDEPVGTVDACVSFAQDMLGSAELRGADLRANRYVEVPLGFAYTTGRLECRLTWNGYSALRVDRVSLFRVEGANPLAGAGRVREAVPSGQPSGLARVDERRPHPEIFPRSEPPAPVLRVLDVRSLRPDARLAAEALQGIANRTQPSVYCLSQAMDEFWLARLKEKGWIEGTETVAGLPELIAQYRDRIHGVVITDPNLPATRNVATMVASVEDALPASPRLAATLGLPTVMDLRGRWATSAEAYEWAFDNLWPRLSHHVIACSWPDHLGLRDYLVENRVFIFWISGALDGARSYASPDAEVRLMERLLAKMPVNIPVMSYPWAGKDIGIGEGPGVTLFAEFGKYLVGSIGCSNLSVHSGIRAPDPRQKPAPPVPDLDPSKTYLSWIISDGDNLPVLTEGNFPQLWRQPTRGKLALGWTLSPSARMLIPDVVDYYYSTATPEDAFIAAVSGVGYTYPDSYGARYRDPDRAAVYDEFLDQTRDEMERSDLREAWIMNATRPEAIARYAERIPFLDALFPDYGRRIATAENASYPTSRNVPVFHAVTTWRMEGTREERIAELVDSIRAMTPEDKPAFLHAFVLNWFVDLAMLDEVMQKLGPGYVAVRPDHLAALCRLDYARRKVIIGLPSAVAAVEGCSLALEGTLRDVAEASQPVRLSVRGGLSGASVLPADVELQPGREQTFALSGEPTGDGVELGLEGSFGRVSRTVRVWRIPRAELLGTIESRGPLVPGPLLEAEALAHRDGVRSPDPAAQGGAVWSAQPGKAEPGYVVFGPYAPLPKGRYVVAFRLRRTSTGSGLLAEVDACVGGGTPQTGSRAIACDDLPVGEFRCVPLVIDHPGGQYETRVRWTGAAGLDVDCVALWREQAP